MTQADVDGRLRRAELANVRQQLQAPVSAILGYGELLHEEASAAGLDGVLSDLERILTAARTLSGIVEGLLDDDVSRGLSAAGDIEAAGKKLRHDLRTPINGIKGYGEMLLEDLEDMGAEALRPDFEKLLAAADGLLAQLGSIVDFSHRGIDAAGAGGAEATTMVAELMERIHSSDESKTVEDETGYILAVDDIESNRDLLSRRLTRFGHRVATAADGQEALDKLEAEEFDLVLLDLMMPGMSGFEVLARMKAHPELRDVPVIMISALDETDSVIKCIEAGADDYLTKPFNPVLLQARIKSGLEKKGWRDDERRQKKFIRQAFSKFIAPAVVDQLVADPSRLTLGGERVELSCLFTDLEGFTSLIENAEPSVVLPVLNRYLDGMCQIALDHGGTIDKIVGDALHVFFGAPVAQPDHPERAIRCALAMDDYAAAFMSEPDAKQLGFGLTRIGVHTGSAVVGNFGGDSFFDYTAHGDTVNTAARMESVNKHLGTRLCVSEPAVSRCKGVPFRPVGTLILKGKTGGVAAFEPLSAAAAASPAAAAYREAFDQLRHDPAAAATSFDRLRRAYPDDRLIAFHAGRLARGESGITIVLADK